MWFICSHTVALHTHHALPRQVSALFCQLPLTSHHRHSTTQTETAVQVPSPSMLVPLLYATSIVGGFFLYCPLPLFFELVVEETYPRISAATSGGVLSILNTLVQVVFLFAPLWSARSVSRMCAFMRCVLQWCSADVDPAKNSSWPIPALSRLNSISIIFRRHEIIRVGLQQRPQCRNVGAASARWGGCPMLSRLPVVYPTLLAHRA